ncbi:MAG: class C sortase [Lachnospiraceae bacterium]|nr:class C sortase [Lachnospiraceae bacterium]MDY5742101.1 class C sortase [Lachnospiraceae bacterium]
MQTAENGHRQNTVSRKINGRTVVYIFFVLMGLIILLYPTISNKWNEYRNKRLISNYEKTLIHKEDTKIITLLKEAERYNATLNEPSVPDAFSIRKEIRDEAYEALLNIENNSIMGYIDIPVLQIQLPIYHYTSDEVLQKGVGHLHGSALPVGGKGTHSVVSAHRGLPSAKLFTDLNMLKEGDHFYYKILGKTFAYEVDQILTVEPQDVKSLSADIGKDYSTLVTCTPYGVNTKRLLVRGHRIEYQEEEYKEEEKHVSRNTKHLTLEIMSAAAGFMIALLVLFMYRLFGKIKRKKVCLPRCKSKKK